MCTHLWGWLLLRACHRLEQHATSRVPSCACGLVMSFRYGRFWCCREPDGCGVSSDAWDEPAEPTRVTEGRRRFADGMSNDAARGTAALLSAAAFGPMNAFSFVAPSDFDLALYARVPLAPKYAICVSRWHSPNAGRSASVELVLWPHAGTLVRVERPHSCAS